MKYDNCKNCGNVNCEHFGKNREFVCLNGISCKVGKAKGENNMLTFDINNGQTMEWSQNGHDDTVHVAIKYNGVKTLGYAIPAGDMVMLFNLYTYTKENDIQNDFINYYGKNKDE